jgi:hypothetical protein
MCFPLHTSNDIAIDDLRTIWAPEIRRYCAGVPFILVGVLDADELPERYRIELGTKLSEGEKLAEELGALEYLECDTKVTVTGVQEVWTAVSIIVFPRLWRLLTRWAGNCCCLGGVCKTSGETEVQPEILAPMGLIPSIWISCSRGT